MRFRFICIALLMSLILTSCKKYLDKKSDDAQVVPTTLDDLQALLDDEGYMNFKTPTHGEASADNYFQTDANYNANTFEQPIYTWQPFVYQGLNWASAYTPVYNANLCMERIQNISITPQNNQQYNNVMGSSLFYRAYYFSQIAWTFAKSYDESSAPTDLGIVLRLSSDFHEPSVRASVGETYTQIINDAKASVAYLPDLPIHSLRPSKAAAYGLLARVYLSMRKYDSAYKYSNLSLGLKNTLLNYSTLDPNNASPFIAIAFGHETIFYTHMTGGIGLTSPNTANIDTTLYASYNSNDLRKGLFFAPLGPPYYSFKGTYGTSKFNLFSGIATDEMYLTRAECAARAGDAGSAMNDLNTLMAKRLKVPVTLTALSASDALNQILTERRKELLMRGLRWMDIKRLNKEGAGIVPTRKIGGNTITLPPNDNRYALPLPDDIVKLYGITQNPR